VVPSKDFTVQTGKTMTTMHKPAPAAAGRATICQRCAHRIAERPDHPSPCKKYRWRGTRHLKPELSADGERCDGFEGDVEGDESASCATT
jgi:hypothetical protein